MKLKHLSHFAILSTVACTAAVLLPVPASIAQEAPATSQPATDLPAAEDVINASIEAMGGREAIEALKQMKATGTFEIPTVGITASLTMLVDDTQAQPLAKMSIDLPGIGVIVRGLTAEGGYEINPMQGNRKLEDAELASMRQEADLQSNLDLEKYYKSWKTIGRADVDGTPAIIVELTDKDGKAKKLYFATEGANKDLVIQSESVESTPMGEIPSISKLSDYREVDGPAGPVKMSFKTTGDNGGQEIIITLKEVNLSPNLTKEELAAPADM